MAGRKTKKDGGGSGRGKAKLFHKIKDVCELTSTEPYVLRYWEQEFPFLAPEKNKAGHRIYTDEDIELVRRIKKLLYDEGYTTAGARRQLEKERAGQAEDPGETASGATAPEAAPADSAELESLRTENSELKGRLAQLEEDRTRLVESLRTLRADAQALRELVLGSPEGGRPAGSRSSSRPGSAAGGAAKKKSAPKKKSSAKKKSTAKKKSVAKKGGQKKTARKRPAPSGRKKTTRKR